MPQQYFAILTAVGEAKDANAKALGIPLLITDMAVGDGNGALPVPDRTRTALVHEVRRAPLNQLSRDPVNTNQVIAEQVIPENVGGWWIREIGLYDDDGDLIAIANCPETYKPQLVEGSGRTQVVRMVLIVSSADTVQLKIDPSVVLSTRKYADDAITASMNAHLAAADPHPQYLTTAEGNTAIAAAVAALVNSSPATLDTLSELAAALGNDANFATTITNLLALKAPLASPALTGTPTVPTAAAGTNTGQAASCAFVTTAISSAGAPGQIAYFARNTAPSGWLKANGSAVLIATYPNLAADIYCGDASNATALFGYKCTNPATPSSTRSTAGTYIVLPDMRAEFIRGWDDARGIDSSRTFGSFQASSFASHNHGVNDPSHSHTLTNSLVVPTAGNTGLGSQGANAQSVGVNGAYTGISIQSTGGTDTLPRNIALLACIKY